MEVTGEVQVDLLHRKHLSVATTGSTALHTEARAERGLTQCDDRLMPEAVHTESEADRDRRLADTSLRSSDGGDEDELARLMTGLELGEVYLGEVLAVVLQVVGGDSHLGSYLFDRLEGYRAGDFDVGLHYQKES